MGIEPASSAWEADDVPYPLKSRRSELKHERLLLLAESRPLWWVWLSYPWMAANWP